MYETLERLAKHLERTRGSRPRIVIWAHNSHVGDARATLMGGGREHNIGQLVRQTYPSDCHLIGFTTSHGTVTAASHWHGEAERKVVRNPPLGSWEELFHAIGIPNFALDLRQAMLSEPALHAPLLERAIGVLYLPQTELYSHYFHARIADQFDTILHYDETRAGRAARAHRGLGSRRSSRDVPDCRGAAYRSRTRSRRPRARRSTPLRCATSAFPVTKLAMGAIGSGGAYYLNTDALRYLNVSRDEVQHVVERERRELERREKLYRDHRPRPALAGKTVTLVDDGIATGSSMFAAIVALRTHDPARIVVAVPVASRETCQQLRREVDDLVCWETPDPFYAVGAYYEDFDQVGDDEVRALLNQAAERPLAP